MDQLLSLVAAAPRLQVLEVHGLAAYQQEKLAGRWAQIKGDAACFQGVLGEAGTYRLATKPM